MKAGNRVPDPVALDDAPRDRIARTIVVARHVVSEDTLRLGDCRWVRRPTPAGGVKVILPDLRETLLSPDVLTATILGRGRQRVTASTRVAQQKGRGGLLPAPEPFGRPLAGVW
jgi:hypothetical protein